MELLFARMAPSMRKRAIARLARFATGSTLPSILAEVRQHTKTEIILLHIIYRFLYSWASRV